MQETVKITLLIILQWEKTFMATAETTAKQATKTLGPENPETIAVAEEAVEVIKTEESIAETPAPEPVAVDNKPETVVEAKTETVPSETKNEEKPKQANPERRAPRIPRQTMRVRAARGTTVRPSMRNYQEPFADKDVPVVRSERRKATMDFSYAYFKTPTQLFSDSAQTFFERNFQRVDRDMLIVSLVCGVVGNEELARAQTEKVDQKCRELQKNLLEAIDHIKRAMAAKGIPEEMQVPSYDHKRIYTPAVHTPLGRVFIDIVQTFDRLNARIDGAWFNGLMTQEKRREMIGAWVRQLAGFVGVVASIRGEAFAEARKVGRQQDAKQIVQAVESDKSNADLKGEEVTAPATGK